MRWEVVISFDVTILVLGIAFNFYWALYQVYRYGDIEIRLPAPEQPVIAETVPVELTKENPQPPDTIPDVQYPKVGESKFSLDDEDASEVALNV